MLLVQYAYLPACLSGWLFTLMKLSFGTVIIRFDYFLVIFLKMYCKNL